MRSSETCLELPPVVDQVPVAMCGGNLRIGNACSVWHKVWHSQFINTGRKEQSVSFRIPFCQLAFPPRWCQVSEFARGVRSYVSPFQAYSDLYQIGQIRVQWLGPQYSSAMHAQWARQVGIFQIQLCLLSFLVFFSVATTFTRYLFHVLAEPMNF